MGSSVIAPILGAILGTQPKAPKLVTTPLTSPAEGQFAKEGRRRNVQRAAGTTILTSPTGLGSAPNRTTLLGR